MVCYYDESRDMEVYSVKANFLMPFLFMGWLSF